MGHLSPHQALIADFGIEIVPVVHNRRQQVPALLIRQGVGNTATHRGNERVGRAEVNTDGEPVFMRRGGLAGFADLQQCHGLNQFRGLKCGTTLLQFFDLVRKLLKKLHLAHQIACLLACRFCSSRQDKCAVGQIAASNSLSTR